MRRSRPYNETIIIELRGEYCKFRYFRRTRLSYALEECDPKELLAKIREYRVKNRTKESEEALSILEATIK